MSKYSKEKQKEHMAKIRQIIVINPNASILQIQTVLEKNNYPLDKNYIGKLLRKIASERASRYNSAAAHTAIAKFEDFVKYVENELLKIAKESPSDMVKTVALSNTVKHHKEVLNLQFDMGVFERKIGSSKVEITNIAEILKIITDAENK